MVGRGALGEPARAAGVDGSDAGQLVRAVGDWDASGAWAEDGAASPVGWLRSRGAMTDSAASQLLNSARLARDHAPTGDALRAGRLPVANLYRIGQVVGERMAAFRANPELLLHPAAEMTPAQFKTVANRWRRRGRRRPRPRRCRGPTRRAIPPRVQDPGWDGRYRRAARTGGRRDAAAVPSTPTSNPTRRTGHARRASQRRADAFVDVVCAAIEHHNQGGQYRRSRRRHRPADLRARRPRAARRDALRPRPRRPHLARHPRTPRVRLRGRRTSSCAAAARYSTSGGGPGSCPAPSAARSYIATAVAPSRAATDPTAGATPTT